ncbi:MAG: hypothetical protein CMJ25_19000 [Phycisphaerae bacterium]|nr:hypothetical protein [Phycisphaerae bacterium]|tara:strand:- start:65 stop:526 length:462 start_codon:yes stop_codon:yes gene_type:complete
MKNLNEIKNKISKYDWMTHSEYKNLKQEIFALDDDSISELYSTTMDIIDERETELYFLEAEAERDMKDWYARTKYFKKLYSEVSDYMHDLFDKEMESEAKKTIEQKLKETDTEILVKYLEFIEDVNNKVSTLSKEERAKHIYISKGILFARGC